MSDLDKLEAAISQTAKYRHLDRDVVRRVGARELAIRPNLKAAIKATKTALHQAGGAFFDGPVDYDAALARLQEAAVAGPDSEPFREASRATMAAHTSTRERLPILDTFFAETLGSLPPVRSVIDIAAGLNPLARPWMPLDPAAVYIAIDMYSDMVAFLNEAMPLSGPGRAAMGDVIADPPRQPADVALILKTLPCLETADKNAPARLLDAVEARWLLVSFPAQSLTGRRKGQAAHYESRFRALLDERGWPAQRFEFETELAFLVKKGQGQEAG